MIRLPRFVVRIAVLSLAPLGAALGLQVPRNDRASVVGTAPSKPRVWPEPPDAPRIVLSGTLASERDIGKRLTGLAAFRAKVEGSKEVLVGVQRPFDVVVDAAQRVFVTDGGRNQVMVFDPATHEAHPLGESGPGRLASPVGLGIDDAGNIYVADRGSKRAVAFTPAGAFLRAYGNAELLLNPVDVAVDGKAGLVYVSDSFLHQVLVFRQSDGALLRRIGRSAGEVSASKRAAAAAPSTHGKAMRDAAEGPAAAGGPDAATPGHGGKSRAEPRDVVLNRGTADGEFRYPSFIAVSGAGELYVTDGLNSRVQAFGRDGRFARQVGKAGDGPGSFARPKGLAVDSEGHVYVVDAAFNNVQIFDDKARLLLFFGQMGQRDGEFDLPSGMFIDASDRIYVADRANNRVVVLQYLRERAR